MQSLIHLYNAALAELGGEQLPQNISPIESDAVGAICQNIFPHALDCVLEAHAWGFARKRAVLALLPEQAPESPGYRLRYAAPSDCVRPIAIEPPGGSSASAPSVPCLPSIIEGQSILCNVEQAALLYVCRVTEPKRWPAYFAEALVWKMAASLATARNNDKAQKQSCWRMYEYALAAACAKDRAMRNERGRLSPWRAARGNARGGGC